MNKALKLLVMYFVFAVAFIVLGTAFYFLYLNVLNFSAGHEMLFFNKELVFKSFMYMCCILAVIICPCLAYFRIRHRGGIIQLLFYIALCAVTWILLFPLCLNKGAGAGVFEESKAKEHVVTAGYFRESEGTVYYLSKDLKSSEAGSAVDSVIIDTGDTGTVKFAQITSSPDFRLFKNAEPYSDILLKQSFGNSSTFKEFSFRDLLIRAAQAKTKGGTFWLGFLSLALALCCVYGISHMFDWKLVNASFVILFTGFILCINLLYFGPLFENLRTKLAGNGLMISLSTYFDAPLLVLFNLFLSFVFIVIGIIRFFKKNSDADEAQGGIL